MKISEERMWKLQQLESLILKMVPVLLSFSQVKTGQFYEGAEYRGAKYNIGKTVEFRNPAEWGGKMPYIRPKPLCMDQ
ncbi:hypothetical protein KUTeg_004663 [Tegillarca granosa]|uniref:Uncharacterized protein n=1 Tax=Tegillarca granosa TaxID=220873 RepID=A0ABQ9FNF6_TEGGR|nr:hypothetical protein KUTeg_004663 [Tegillarca granosa]